MEERPDLPKPPRLVVEERLPLNQDRDEVLVGLVPGVLSASTALGLAFGLPLGQSAP
jgi:hypothetical protein